MANQFFSMKNLWVNFLPSKLKENKKFEFSKSGKKRESENQ